MTSHSRVGTLIATFALVLAACGGSAATQAPASPAAASPAASAAESEAASASACSATDVQSGTPAEIKDFAFPAGLSITAGQAIEWTNGDSANHTVTFDDGSCSTDVAAGSTVVVSYSVPGTHAFHCSIHPSMTGSIEVK